MLRLAYVNEIKLTKINSKFFENGIISKMTCGHITETIYSEVLQFILLTYIYSFIFIKANEFYYNNQT